MVIAVIQLDDNLVVIALGNDSPHCVVVIAYLAACLIDIAVFAMLTLVAVIDYNYAVPALMLEHCLQYHLLIVLV